MLNSGSPSSALLNNLGYHYLTCGSPEKARAAFERILKTDPSHLNANLELARLAVQGKQGTAALNYLAHISGNDPEATLVRAEALDLTGKRVAAIQILKALAQSAGGDPRVQFAIGMTDARLRFYPEAEKAFSEVLRQDPDDFEVLYNLGLAAARALDNERAQRALEGALKSHPQDVDTLYELGRLEQAEHDYLKAVYYLSQARKLASQRADVALALARAAQSGSYYGDAILAYDEYLELRPKDDLVLRDRALVFGFSHGGLQEGLRTLKAYVERHPDDAVGYYDLAQLSDRVERKDALQYVTRAAQISPGFEKAHYYRGWLLEQLGRFDESALEVQRAIQLDASDVRALDLLGLNRLNLDQPAQAAAPLQSALVIAPNDQDVLFHLCRALIETGHARDAQPLLQRFKQAQSEPRPLPREEAGIIEAASLSSADRAARVVSQLRQYAVSHPADSGVKLNLGKALLAAGRTDEASAVFHELLSMGPPPDMLADAGAVLLRFGQYSLARQFLEPAAVTVESAKLDLASALFVIDGPRQALRVLDQIQDDRKTADRLLLKVKILDALGQREEADAALTATLDHPISRPQLAVETVRILLRHGQSAEALELTEAALRTAPDDPDLLLTKATALRSANRRRQAEETVKQIEDRWPEWDEPYLLDALLLGENGKVAEAKRKVQVAVALGTSNEEAQCTLQRIASGCSCELFFPCDHPAEP